MMRAKGTEIREREGEEGERERAVAEAGVFGGMDLGGRERMGERRREMLRENR